MAISNEYQEALKKAQKEYRACVSRGIYPYLPVLDDVVDAAELLSTACLGTIQIPMEFVVGTKSAGRTQAFARNFMPLLKDGTEFANKWSRLCQAHLEEGIRDPVKVYEYMNRYYVEEGNKRVSVLKFFGAQTIYAQVTRMLPQRSDAPEVARYYEFVDFYQYSRVNSIEFSKPGSYVKLQELVGKQPGEMWSDDDRSHFSTAYYYFRLAYKACGGDRLSSTAGDALLAYCNIYGYDSLRAHSEAEIKRAVSRAWEEISLQQEPAPIDVKLAPEEEKKSGDIISRVLTKTPPKVMKVAFIHDKTPERSGWTYGHEVGRKHLELAFDGEVQTEAYYNALEGDPLPIIEQAIADGCTLLFTTSPRLLPASLRAAVDHPEVTILNCSLNTSHRYVRTYYARMYEVKFISGAIAGALAGGDDVGYICDYPIYGQVAGINAFALGLQLTSPISRVHLEWSSVSSYEDAAERLRARGIRLISAQDLARMGKWRETGEGLCLMDREPVVLAMPVWQWGAYYEAMLRRIRSKSLQLEYQQSHKALNYYWGLSAGVVGLHCSNKLPEGAKKLAALLRDGICSGSCVPFRGPIHDQSGNEVIGEKQALTAEQIINMDYLVDNVVGMIPAYYELSETGKATVGIVGVPPSTKEKSAETPGVGGGM